MTIVDPKNSGLSRVAVLGDYLPRQCGIATFTTDLCEAIAGEFPDTNCFAVSVNDTEDGYAYPPRVRFELVENDLETYRCAADFLNMNNADVVCLQHEYGIYGGQAGSYILELLRELRMPVVTTLHTVLESPSLKQRRVLQELAQLSDRLIVMSARAVKFLQDIYGVPAEKIDLIPHGIHDVAFVDPSFHKDKFGVEGRLVLLTFGLLSPNKGIEHVIEALPSIVSRHPNVVYMVLGATHPNVQRNEGESYRQSLERLARERGVEANVEFHNRFVSLKELVEFIGAADLYITPYLNREQITSGTLAYAVGAGKAVVSTPYWHAEELLAEGRGVLVPFADPAAIATRVLELLDNEVERHAMRKRAYLHSREMTWPKTALRYVESFQRARVERTRSVPRLFPVGPSMDRRGEFPLLKLDHLRRLTDDTGMAQHAVFSVPNWKEGYTTDDNARALALTVLLEELAEDEANETRLLPERFLAFLWNAFAEERGRFRNFLTYDRRWCEEIGSEDSHGRALYSLGLVIGRSSAHGHRGMASRLFEMALPAVNGFTSPRAWAFTLLGTHEYLRRFPRDRVVQGVREALARRLVELYGTTSTPDWRWFEESLSYCNATLPHALLCASRDLASKELADVGFATLDWLTKLQSSPEGFFAPVGSNGFYTRGGERARFDQQPIEAYATISACLEAHRLSGDKRWADEARRAFEWFLGQNSLRLPLYDARTGGCRDGLHTDRTNQNQGAESTLAFWLSLLDLRLSSPLQKPINEQEDSHGTPKTPSPRSAVSTPQGEPHPERGPVAV